MRERKTVSGDTVLTNIEYVTIIKKFYDAAAVSFWKMTQLDFDKRKTEETVVRECKKPFEAFEKVAAPEQYAEIDEALKEACALAIENFDTALALREARRNNDWGMALFFGMKLSIYADEFIANIEDVKRLFNKMGQ